MNEDCMLTTYDNQFDPFTEFAVWWKEDLRLGHDTCGLLARYANTSSTLSDSVNDEIIADAMDEIVHRYPMIYKKVYLKDAKPKHSDPNRQY